MKLKRIMAMVLCFAMVLSTMSFTVFAEDALTATPEDFASVLMNAPEGSTIQLTASETAYGFYHWDVDFKDITIIGADGATVNKFQVNGTVENLVFQNVAFTAGISFNDTQVNGLTFDGCTFTTEGVAITAGNSASNPNATRNNVTIKDCSFTGSVDKHSLDLGELIGDTKIEGNTFTNVRNAFQMSVDAGTVLIDDNTISNTGDRAMRLGTVGADITMTISNNIMTDACDDDNEVFKVDSVADGSTIKFEGNSYDGEAWNAETITGPTGAVSVGVVESAPDVTGTITPCYTSANRFWGEAKTNSTESLVVELYEGESKIASASLNNIDGIIDGDVFVTWGIGFNENNDGHWNVEWAEGYPKYDMNPDTVKLVADGVEVAENNVCYNAPDNLNKIVAIAEGFTGGVVAYTSLKDAIGKFNGRKVNVLRDVSESIDGFYGCTLTTNVEGGVTITDTNTEDWIDFDDVTVGKGVTVDIELPFSGDSENVIMGTLVAGDTYYHGYDAKTTIKDGGKVIVEGTTILRYNETDDAGLYIYGDGDDSTIEFDCGYYIGAYSGTFYAENANVEAGYVLFKNSYDNDNYANAYMTLDNSAISVTGTSDGQSSFVIDDKTSLTMKNGSAIENVRDFNVLTGASLTFNADATSSISATNMNIADDAADSFKAIKNEDGTFDLVSLAPVNVSTYEELIAALEKPYANVVMTNDITATATQGSGYGKAGIVLDAGDVLDGNNFKLTINDANTTWDCAIAMRGGTVKNLTVAGAMRGVFMPGANGDVIIDNCVFEDVVYTFNSDAGSKDYTVTIMNTALNGWTSFSDAHKSVTFENCTFGEGNGYAYCRPYNETVKFIGCEFDEGFEFDASRTTNEFEDCMYAGKELNAETAAPLFADGGTVIIDGETTTFSVYVPPVAKIGNDDFASIQAAVDAAQDGDVITLLADVTENVTIKKSITIDGADKTYTGGITVGQGSTVEVTIKNVNFASGDGYAVTTDNIKGITIDNCKATGKSLLNAKKSTPNITMKNVNVSGANYVARICYGSVAYLENVTAEQMTGFGIQTQNWGAKTITLKNCSFDTPNYPSLAVSVKGTAVDTFVFQGENSMTSMSSSEYAKYALGDNATLTAPEGYTVTADNDAYFVKYVDGTYKAVKAIAKIGDVIYDSLEEAIAIGGNVVLLTDLELENTITIKNNVTLDLNGKTITGTDKKTSGNFYLFDNRGEFTVTGNGTITLTAETNRGWGGSSVILANNPGGKLTVVNGTFEHLGGSDMAYAIDNLTNGKGTYAETIINGGTIKSTYRAVRQFLNGIEAQNILTVNGGTIEGANKSIWMQDPSKNANSGTLTVGENAALNGDVYLSVTEGSTAWPVKVSIAKAALKGESEVLTSNVPFGYEIYENNGSIGVEFVTYAAIVGETGYRSLQAAVNALNGEGTITLLRDVTEEFEINAPVDSTNNMRAATEGLVIDLAGYTLNGAILPSKGNITVKNGSIVNTNSGVSGIEITEGELNLYDVNISSARHAVRIDGDVTAVVNNGTYRGGAFAGTGTYHAFNISGTADVTFNGGTFIGPKGTSADSGSAVNVKAGSAVTINEGTFTGGKNATLSAAGTITIYGGAYDQDPSAYVAKDYAAYVNADGTFRVSRERSLNVSAWKSEVVAGEDVTIAVTLSGENLADAKWKLTYDKTKFQLKNNNVITVDNGDGTVTIEGREYLTDGNTYANGKYWTYDFIALAQTEEVTSDFVISETHAYTYMESFEGTDVITTNNGKATVKILLKNYQVVASFDDSEVEPGTSKEIAYDGVERTFVVTTEPTATVKYTVNGEEVNEVVIKEEGSYVINYTVIPAAGYAKVEGTYTVNVKKPEYLVEFVNNYVAGKTLVLVYTNTDNVFFAYDGELMIDVTARGYTYKDGVETHEHVFGFVTNGIAMGTLADYEAEVKHFYGTGDFYTIVNYDEDVNFDTDYDIRDITTVYGVINVNAQAFANAKYQKQILKSDVVKNKCVDGDDANAVVEKVYPTQNN